MTFYIMRAEAERFRVATIRKEWYFGSETVLYDARQSIFGAFYSTAILAERVVFWTRNIVMRTDEFWSILQSRGILDPKHCHAH